MTFVAVYPQRQAGFAVMLNLATGPARQVLIVQLEAAALKLPQPTVQAPAAVPVSTPAASDGLSASSWRALRGVYQTNWLGKVELCEPGTLQLLASPRLLADLRQAPATGDTLVRWRDSVLDSDARREPEPITTQPGSVLSFRLLPLGASDFDFGWLRFQRRGDCR